MYSRAAFSRTLPVFPLHPCTVLSTSRTAERTERPYLTQREIIPRSMPCGTQVIEGLTVVFRLECTTRSE